MILDRLLENKEFVFTIQWNVDVEEVFTEDLSEYIERLREIGGAEITEIELKDRK